MTDSRVALVLIHLADPPDADDAGDLLRAVSALDRPVSVVLIGEEGQAERGLGLLRQGALNYLERPLNLGRLASLIDSLTVQARYQLARTVRAPFAVTPAHATCNGDFIYDPSAAMGRVMAQVRHVAPVDTTVLIQGETGTGKTRLARVIHDLSSHRGGRFLVVNCAALSATLIESELFGHVKGAFTGADRDRVGKFADAAGGTLFLDEIDSLPLDLQAKLLRAVDDRVFEPVGSNRSEPVRARLVAASNRPLDREVTAGRFRSDLYFRLNVVTFDMPPLREQGSVLPALIERFVVEFASRAGRAIAGVAPAALSALLAYQWPGNVRELRNAIERAVALRPGGDIELDDLPDAVRASAGPAAVGPSDRVATLTETKETAEANRILTALKKYKNNRLRAAAELGISRMTLYKKLHRYGLINAVV
ncbi:MAG TPA: sigma-54 dependent transcriptional regulator [Fimbriiglobus sp.]|nr:sigma-54 dependent transcriptional regulator [Fimbriiglobus sp.]